MKYPEFTVSRKEWEEILEASRARSGDIVTIFEILGRREFTRILEGRGGGRRDVSRPKAAIVPG